jgi:hypothetical protein
MSTAAIFLLGLLVSGITFTAVVLIGLGEAGDSDHSRPEDLTPIEQALVDREDLDSAPPS